MIQAHDIVLFDKHEIEGFTLPEWVVLTEKMFGTVRRASTDHAEILPIGLRGPARNQRWATEIIEQESYRQEKIMDYPVYQQFHAARNILSGCKWGIGGSLGFELSTGIPAVKETSDFDLLLYANSPIELPIQVIQSHPAFFEQFDTQVVTRQGGFSLKEYLREPEKKIQLKTVEGPKLTKELW